MPPDDHAQDTDTDQAAHQESIAKHRFAGKNYGYLGCYCHGRQGNYVHLGVSHKPEQVLVQPVTPTGSGPQVMPFVRITITVVKIFMAARVVEIAKTRIMKQYASMPGVNPWTARGA